MHKPSIVKELMASADSFIIQFDRLRYIDAYFAIETYLAGHKCLVGGAMAQAILMQGSDIKNRDSFTYEAYTESPYYFGRAMTQSIYDHVALAATSNMKDYSFILDTICFETNVVDHIFTIWINNRAMVKIVALNKYRGQVSLIDIVMPIKKTSLLFPDIILPLISPEIFLIDLYQRMYNPYPSGGKEYRSYPVLIEQERAIVKASDSERIKDDACSHRTGSGPGSAKTDHNIKMLLAEALLESIGSNIILIGDMAAQGFFSSESGKNRARMQFLTDLPPGSVLAAVSVALDNLQARLTVQFIEYDLHLPVDIYLKKYILYGQSDASDPKMPLLEFFNSPTYECIATMSTERPGILRASWPCLLRFRYIDIWGLSIIRGLKKMSLAATGGSDKKIKIKFSSPRNAVKDIPFGDAGRLSTIEDALAALLPSAEGQISGAVLSNTAVGSGRHNAGKHGLLPNKTISSPANLQFFDMQIASMKQHIVELRQHMYKAFEDVTSLALVFPIDASNYFGTFIDENVRRKAIIKEKNEGRRFPRFFPGTKKDEKI
jgi:hypothetical protein